MSIFAELKRRKVVQVAVIYAVTAWLLVQIIVTIEAPLSLPAWTDTLVIVLLILGFPIVMIMSWVFNLTPEGLVRDQGAGASSAEGGRTIEYVLIGLLVVVVSWLFFREVSAPGGDTLSAAAVLPAAPAVPVGGTPGDGAAAEPPAAAARDVLPNSVAVLLCDNFSTDPENDFFAASLHEEMLNQLVKLRNLNVIARTSVLQYADSERPIPDIANELRVQSVMECSVAYGDGRIVISAQLIDGDTGLHIWSERYNREFSDVFGIQSDIAMNVANALAIEFSLTEQAAIEQAPTDSPEAYALYLEGLAAENQGDAAAISLYDQALGFDPDFAAAHLRKAIRHEVFLINSTGSNAVGVDERARHSELAQFHGNRAVELDPSFAWAAGRTTDFTSWRWTDLLTAAEEAPDPLAQGIIWTYSYAGRHDRALARARRGVELNPNDWNQLWTLGVALAYAGQWDEAARVHREAIAQAPAVPVMRSWLAYIEIARGNDDTALAELERTEQLLASERPTVFLPELAYSYSRIGHTADVERIVAEIEARGGDIEIGAGGRAMMALATGNRAGAIVQLERGVAKVQNNEIDEGFFNLVNIKMNVTADPLLEEPEFAVLREQIDGS